MKPTTCTLLISIFISTSLHVLGNYVPIIRRPYCIYATLVFFKCREVEINIPRSSVHLFGFIWKRLYRNALSTKHKNQFDVWLTVHCSSMWNKKPTICHLVLYLFLLYRLLNMFRATLCSSSGADNLVVFFRVWCNAVTLSRQLLRMGTRWPKTCWATYKGEINIILSDI